MLRASGPATGAGAHKPRTAQVCRSQPPSQAAPSAPRDKPTSDSLNELRVPQLQRPTRLQPMNRWAARGVETRRGVGRPQVLAAALYLCTPCLPRSALPLESRGNNRLQLVNQTLLDRLREEAGGCASQKTQSRLQSTSLVARISSM